MNYLVRFYVPASRAELEAAMQYSLPCRIRQVLECNTEEGSFLWRLFRPSESAIRRFLPEGFRMDIDSALKAIIYVEAGDIAKLDPGYNLLDPLDAAVVAYIKALPPGHPLIPYGLNR